MLPLILLITLLDSVTAQTGQWKRTQCGGFTDLVTQWGLEIDPFTKPVLPDYPRPQLVRTDDSWLNLNGLWGFTFGGPNDPPPFGKTLNGSILVPFPAESCLSGVGQTGKYLWYRTTFDLKTSWTNKVLLHFGAVDWQTTVWVNTVQVGTHSGGYDPFSFDITGSVHQKGNELIVFVYDPSDDGFQPNGKQRISAITDPDGDTYTPSSGIWQTVWLENVPSTYINKLVMTTDTRSLTVNANVNGAVSVRYTVYDGPNVVLSVNAQSNVDTTIEFPTPKIWDPSNPFLYDLVVSTPTDQVKSYFGLRSIAMARVRHPGTPDSGPQMGIDRPGFDLPGYPIHLPKPDYNLCWDLCNKTDACLAWAYEVASCNNVPNPFCWLKGTNPGTTSNACRISGAKAQPSRTVSRPFLNGGFLFMAGWLDQSYWPDGLYTAPTDDALKFDLEALSTFGLNTVRLHQKVNPQRWYYYADQLGIIVIQDMIQKYGGATKDTIPPFYSEYKAMVEGLYNHPSIIQWTVFNEGDCVGVFNVTDTVSYAQSLDSTRLYDTNSGGPANDLHIADVNDIHTYPYPGDPIPTLSQYGMIGEYGGVGAFVAGHEWVPGKCQTYLQVNSPQEEADTYIDMTKTIASRREDISVCIYTQISDVERECDGFLNYDRTNKFTPEQTTAIKNANLALIAG